MLNRGMNRSNGSFTSIEKFLVPSKGSDSHDQDSSDDEKTSLRLQVERLSNEEVDGASSLRTTIL